MGGCGKNSRLPILNDKTLDSRELSGVVGNENRAVCCRYRCDEQIIWPNRRPRRFELLPYAAVMFRGNIVEE
jgi:hypothetical protein